MGKNGFSGTRGRNNGANSGKKVSERVSLWLDSHFSWSAVIGENSFDYSQLQDSEHEKDLEMALRLFHPEKSIA